MNVQDWVNVLAIVLLAVWMWAMARKWSKIPAKPKRLRQPSQWQIVWAFWPFR